MRLGTLAVTLALLTTGLAGCLSDDDALDPSQAPDAPGGPPGGAPGALSAIQFDGIEQTTEWIPSSMDDTELRVDVYKPADAPENATFPTILVLSPYWSFVVDRKDSEQAPTWYIPYFVPRGYAVALGEMRGTRDSGGCWDFGGELDQQDGHDMVEALASEPWSNGKVGMLGQSHVGMSQIAAAITAPEHLTTIVPIAAVSDWYRYLHKAGAPYESNRLTPPAYFAVHASPSTESVGPDWLLTQAQTACPDNIVHLSQAAELDGDKDAYWQERDLIAGASNIQASVFLVHGFLDENVKTDHFLDFWQALPEEVERKAWFGQWYHEHPGFHEWREDLHRWFDHELLGYDNGILDEPRVTVQANTGEARTEANWPSESTHTTDWMLQDDKLLAVENATAGDTERGQASYASIPGQDRNPGMGPLTTERVAFATGPLDEPLHLAGQASLTLEASLDQPTARWIAVLVDIGPDGGEEISRAYLDARHREGWEQGEDVPVGEAIVYEFDFYPRDHVVEAGHTLELLMLGGDMGCVYPTAGGCEGTGILPVARPVVHTVHTGPGSQTRLHLPLLEEPGPAYELTELEGWLEDPPE